MKKKKACPVPECGKTHKVHRYCDLPVCDKPHKARGYCYKHYYRHRQGYDPAAELKRGPKMEDHPEYGVWVVRRMLRDSPKVSKAAIAERAGISRQRVYVIIKKYKLE